MKRPLALLFAFVVVGFVGDATRSNADTLTMRPAPAVSAPTRETTPPTAPAACPSNMIEVEGEHCPDVEQECIRWVSKKKLRCAEFAPTTECPTATVHEHFCIDKYEYPNREGENPTVMKNWLEARVVCQNEGKRLCTESEWTLACEGPDRLAYPYGQARDNTACNIDKPSIQVNEDALAKPGPRRTAEVKRLWQGEPSGSRERCKSPFGVYDMTGNVDEWTVNETGKPHRSALKGGYWSWVRGRCRPATLGHAEDFRYYQIGFRCCTVVPKTSNHADVSAQPEAR